MEDKSLRATSRYKKQMDRKEKAKNKIKDETSKIKSNPTGKSVEARQMKIKRLEARIKRKDEKASRIAERETKRTGPKEVVVTAKRVAPKSRLTRTTNSTKFGGKLMKEDI